MTGTMSSYLSVRQVEEAPNVLTPVFCDSVALWEAWTHQSTEQVHSLQYELLVADSGHSQILQLLVGDTQQLVPPYFLLLEGLNVLLQAVVQAWRNHTEQQQNFQYSLSRWELVCWQNPTLWILMKPLFALCVLKALDITFLSRICAVNL